jgi:hypothetical protein
VRLSAFKCGVLLFSLLVLSACRVPWNEAKAKQAQADARQIMSSLQKPDMAAYRDLTLPATERAAFERQWPAIRAKFALESKEQENFNTLLLRFIEPNAEKHLQRDLNAKIKPIRSEIDSKWPLMQSSLTLLLKGWIETNQQLSRAEKDHGKALVAAIIEQMPATWLQDQTLRQRAFTQMVQAVRSTKVQNYQQYNQLSYTEFNAKLTIFLAGLKELGKVYDLDWNAGQSRLEVKVLEQSGNRAKVQIRYPLGKKWVEFSMELIEQNGHWYDASALTLFQDTLKPR